MAYSNAIPIGVIVGLIVFIIILVVLLRWLKKKNDEKEAQEKDLEEAKNETSRAFDDESVLLTPVASPRDALFNPAAHQQGRVTTLYDNPRKAEMDWNAEARRVQSAQM